MSQDWESTGWDTRGTRKAGESKKSTVQKALRSGKVETEKKHAAGENKQGGGASHATRVEAESETFSVATVSQELRKLLQQERAKASLTQKELGTLCSVKSNIIQDFEAGKGVPNNVMLRKIERAIKTKNPAFKDGTFTKAHKKAMEKQKAKNAAAKVKTAGAKKAGGAAGAGGAGGAGAAKQGPVARSRRF